MKKLNVSWNGVNDTTGFLHSYAKSLSCAVKNSPYSDLSEDIVATSGFAFRMWVEKTLCPSAMSIWSFASQKEWIANGGIEVEVINRTWGQNEIEEQRRVSAINLIKQSIDNGIPVVSWDISVPEWGMIIGYDDKTEKLATLSIADEQSDMDYITLGNRELPILNVIAIKGVQEKTTEEIMSDTIALAKSHLNGAEWCGDNSKSGIEAYFTLIGIFEREFVEDISWNMEYYLGTYSALKWYAWKFFEKYGEEKYADLYKQIYDSWFKAFKIKKSTDMSVDSNRLEIVKLLKLAEQAEKEFLHN